LRKSAEVYFHSVSAGFGEASGRLDRFSVTYDCESLPGDFNGNGSLDVADIDRLSEIARLGTHDPAFDLNSDQLVDGLDRTVWVERLKRTYFGDANLDGMFGSADLVSVFVSAEYEDSLGLNSTWSTGDWNGDGEFTSRDLVLAFAGGGYEQGPRAAQTVPEPIHGAGLVSGLIAWLAIRRANRIAYAA
jgi:hypothetical protein